MDRCPGNLSSLVTAAENVARGGDEKDEAASNLIHEFHGMSIDDALYRMQDMKHCGGQGFSTSALTHIASDGHADGNLVRLSVALEPGESPFVPVLDVIHKNGKAANDTYARTPKVSLDNAGTRD